MFCNFCGRELRDDEGCCCCKAVAVRNGEPGFVVTRSIIKKADPLAYNHNHGGVSYKQDQHGKYSSYNTANNSRTYTGSQQVNNNRYGTTGQNNRSAGSKNNHHSGGSNQNNQLPKTSAKNVIIFLFIIIFYIIIRL